LFGELAPAHARQDHVGEEQVNLRAVLLADEQCLAAVRGVEDEVAIAPQDAARERAQLIIVLDEQDRFAAPLDLDRRALGRRDLRLGADARQVDPGSDASAGAAPPKGHS
jgi:hypothetical protein